VRAREEAEKAREEAKAALAARDDADARAKSVAAETAETFAAERRTLQANVVSWETRAREAEDRLREALRVSPLRRRKAPPSPPPWRLASRKRREPWRRWSSPGSPSRDVSCRRIGAKSPRAPPPPPPRRRGNS
jgi:hypothetical protein